MVNAHSGVSGSVQLSFWGFKANIRTTVDMLGLDSSVHMIGA